MLLSNEPRTRVAEVAFHQRQGFLADGNDAFLITLANAADAAGGTIDVHDAKADEFGDAEAGGIENFEHGAIPEAERRLFIGAGKDFFHFFKAQIARKRAPDFGRLQVEGGIFGDEFLDLGVTEEIAQSDEMASDGAALELLAIEASEEIDEIVAANRFESEFAFLAELVEFEEVAAVGGDGVGRKALFHANMGEKGGDGRGDFHQEPAHSSAGSRRVAMP